VSIKKQKRMISIPLSLAERMDRIPGRWWSKVAILALRDFVEKHEAGEDVLTGLPTNGEVALSCATERERVEYRRQAALQKMVLLMKELESLG